MKNKKLIVSLVCLVLVVALMAGVYFTTRPETAAGSKTITVSVTHSDGTVKEFTYHTDEEFLGPVITENGLVEGTVGEYGLVIESVDGEKASWEENQSYWALYIGGEYATTGADTTAIYDGDAFSLVYTIG